MNKKIYLVATEQEEKYLKNIEKNQNLEIIKMGVGGINVINTLSKLNLDKNIKIINFGFVGSNNLEVGTKVKIGKCKLYHPNVIYDETTFVLNGDTICYTSNDFVLKTNIKESVVFDMELAYILALGFKNIESIKIVSDNLSYKKYESEIEKYV